MKSLALAFDAKDLARFCACYWEDATLGRQGDEEPLYTGIDGIRAVYERAFQQDPEARVEILAQLAAGGFVVEKERVTGKDGAFEAVVIYEMRGGRIARQWVAGSSPVEDAGLIALVTDDASLAASWREEYGDRLTVFPDPYALIATGTASPSAILAFSAVHTAPTFALAPGIAAEDLREWLAAQGFKGAVHVLP